MEQEPHRHVPRSLLDDGDYSGAAVFHVSVHRYEAALACSRHLDKAGSEWGGLGGRTKEKALVRTEQSVLGEVNNMSSVNLGRRNRKRPKERGP